MPLLVKSTLSWLLLFGFIVQHKSEQLLVPVTIKQGQLFGHTLHSRSGRSYEAFKGIPYARIPGRFEVHEKQ